MYQKIEYLKWVKCFKCGLPIAVQVGSTIPLGASVRCPRCGALRYISRGSFMRVQDISEEWKIATLQSLGIHKKDS